MANINSAVCLTDEEQAQYLTYIMRHIKQGNEEKARNLLEIEIPANKFDGGGGPELRMIMGLVDMSKVDLQEFFDNAGKYISNCIIKKNKGIMESGT